MEKNTNNYDLNQLKQEIKLVDLAIKDGIKLKKMASGEYVCLCPFHDDKTPSLHINSNKNVFHCKGCGASGSNIDWIKNKDNVTESQAIKVLNDMAPTLFVNGNSSSLAVSSVSVKIDITKPEYQKLFMLVLGYYHNRLKETKEATVFMIKRHLKAGELLEKFQVGYCPGDLLSKLSLNDTKQIQMLKEMGILNEKGNERFYRCVVFPLFDLNGNIVQIYGRSITAENASKHNLLPSTLAGIFNKHAFQSSELFITESVIDALSLMQLGITNVTSTLGVGGLTSELLDKISHGSTGSPTNSLKRIYICFDNDKAGNDGAVKLTEKLKEFGCDVYRIEFEKSKDANDFLRRCDTIELASTNFKVLINDAPVLFQLRKEEETIQEATATTEDQAPIENYKKIGNEYQFNFGPRGYVVRGLEKNTSDTSLKIFLKVMLENRFHIDNSLDLFNPKTKTSFIKYAALELEINEDVIKEDLGKMVSTLDSLLQKQLDKNSKPEKKKEYFTDIAITYQARTFLQDPMFIVQFVKDVEQCGFVGEPLNAFFGFIATLSRWLDYQIHIIIQSESSAGKSTFLNLLHDFTPPEDRIYSTQLTPRSLYYDDGSLIRKSYFIAEANGLKEAEFPIMQMMSEGKLSIDYTKNDPKTGENKRDSHEAKGPVQFNITEPEESLNEQMINRSVTLFLNMSKAQTEKILDYQRRLYSPEGLKLRKQKEKLSIFYQHVQREIKPLEVLNFYSPFLDYDADDHLARRNNRKYLTIVNLVTLIHQHQREIIDNNGKQCIKTHIIDIAISHFIFRRLFKNSLDDLPVQSRNLLNILIKHFLEKSKKEHIEFNKIPFYRKEVCKVSRLSMTRVHEHIRKLMFNEYLVDRRDASGIAYRFNFSVTDNGEITKLRLATIKDLLKKASAKEKNDYESFKASLVLIFKALDPSYETDSGEEL